MSVKESSSEEGATTGGASASVVELPPPARRRKLSEESETLLGDLESRQERRSDLETEQNWAPNSGEDTPERRFVLVREQNLAPNSSEDTPERRFVLVREQNKSETSNSDQEPDAEDVEFLDHNGRVRIPFAKCNTWDRMYDFLQERYAKDEALLDHFENGCFHLARARGSESGAVSIKLWPQFWTATVHSGCTIRLWWHLVVEVFRSEPEPGSVMIVDSLGRWFSAPAVLCQRPQRLQTLIATTLPPGDLLNRSVQAGEYDVLDNEGKIVSWYGWAGAVSKGWLYVRIWQDLMQAPEPDTSTNCIAGHESSPDRLRRMSHEEENGEGFDFYTQTAPKDARAVRSPRSQTPSVQYFTVETSETGERVVRVHDERVRPEQQRSEHKKKLHGLEREGEWDQTFSRGSVSLASSRGTIYSEDTWSALSYNDDIEPSESASRVRREPSFKAGTPRSTASTEVVSQQSASPIRKPRFEYSRSGYARGQTSHPYRYGASSRSQLGDPQQSTDGFDEIDPVPRRGPMRWPLYAQRPSSSSLRNSNSMIAEADPIEIGNPNYQRPRQSDDGSWLAFDIPLKNISLSDSFMHKSSYTSGWDRMTDLKVSGSRYLDILTALQHQSYGKTNITLECNILSSSLESRPPQMQWLHVQERPNFGDVRQRMLSAPGLYREELALADKLLYDMQSSSSLAYEGLPEPGTVLRYDSRAPESREDASDDYAVFLSLPIFLAGAPDDRASDKTQMPTLSARHWLNKLARSDPGTDQMRSEDHGERKANGTKPSVMLGQVWVFLFKKVLVTISECSLDALLVQNWIVDLIGHQSSQPRLARLRIANSSEVHYLTLDPPPSLPTFQQTVHDVLSRSVNAGAIQVFLSWPDNGIITATSWRERLKNETAAILEISVEMRQGRLRLLPWYSVEKLDARSESQSQAGSKVEEWIDNTSLASRTAGRASTITGSDGSWFHPRPREDLRSINVQRRSSPAKQQPKLELSTTIVNASEREYEIQSPITLPIYRITSSMASRDGAVNSESPGDEDSNRHSHRTTSRHSRPSTFRHMHKWSRPRSSSTLSTHSTVPSVKSSSVQGKLVRFLPGTATTTGGKGGPPDAVPNRDHGTKRSNTSGVPLASASGAASPSYPSSLAGLHDQAMPGASAAGENTRGASSASAASTIPGSPAKLEETAANLTNGTATPARANQRVVEDLTPAKDRSPSIESADLPCFFSWATEPSDLSERGSSSGVSEGHAFRQILMDLHRRLRPRPVYSACPKASLQEIEQRHRFLSPDSAGSAQQLETTDAVRHEHICNDLSRHIFNHGLCNKADLEYHMKGQYSLVCRTIDKFLPRQYSTSALHRIWGSLDASFKALQDDVPTSTRWWGGAKSKVGWVVRDECTSLALELGIKPPLAVEESCLCQRRTFDTASDAALHLQNHHYAVRANDIAERPPGIQVLRRFLLERPPEYGRERLSDLFEISRLLYLFMKKFYDEIVDFIATVAMNLQDREVKLQLPESVVDAFEKYILALAYHSFALQCVERHYTKVMQSSNARTSAYIKTLLSLHGKLESRSQEAFDACNTAQRDMGLMMSTLARPSRISLRAVKPPFLVAHLCGCSQTRMYGRSEDVMELYTKAVSELRTEVEKRPRKRLLESIYDLEREISSTRATMLRKKKLAINFVEVLRPSSFRVTDQARSSNFPHEEQYLLGQVDQCDAALRVLDNMLQETRSFGDDVKRRVEAVQEDHGKAILVFTVITTIFLPLTFITGFFGMNTSDIRDLSAGQSLFWAVAVPFTTSITTLTLLIAFKGTTMMRGLRRYVDAHRNARPVILSRSSAAPFPKHDVADVEQREVKRRWRAQPKRTGTMNTMEMGLR